MGEDNGIKIKTNIAETVFPRITVADKQAVILQIRWTEDSSILLSLCRFPETY